MALLRVKKAVRRRWPRLRRSARHGIFWSTLLLSACYSILSSASLDEVRAHAQAILYIEQAPTPAEYRNTHAKYEPALGCYLGAFIDFDGQLNRPFKDQNNTVHQDPTAFESIVGKSHAMYFFYLGYGKPLPMDWVRSLALRNKFVQVALEPNGGLGQVKDDAYLHKLAAAMARSGARIFLRFASEMNGTWTNYHRSPTLYRQKFKLVHDIMHKLAPNVAMVWCPYISPQRLIPRYYPGDDATDWVGVNMYSVTYHNNHLWEPAEYEHPCDLLSYVYNRYSARKPIIICEYGATHRAMCELSPRPDFAMRKILTLYAALPTIFPRVKCIDYFDGNATKFVGDHAYNDYSVTDDSLVKSAYSYAISSPYFLSVPLPSPTSTPPVPLAPVRMKPGDVLRGHVRLTCWARSPSDMVKVRYKLDGYTIYTASRPDLWACIWDAGSVRPGRHKLTLEALRHNGTVAARETIPVETQS